MNQKITEVRTRFAPSPTGSIHIGGIRTALFNYFYARTHNGKFILRIEDTDQARNIQQSETEIFQTLAWLQLAPDEAPKEAWEFLSRETTKPSEGPFGSYRQSERLQKYAQEKEKLLAQEKAYPCFCDDSELKQKQQQAIKMRVPFVYDGKCRNISQKEVQQKIASGQPYSIRFSVPSDRQIRVNDLVQGVVRFESSLIGDFIIVKSNGFPSYNFAVVVDDAAMKISHVIRGVGHLSNTPRQILLYEAFGYGIPEFAHISEIVGADKKKLSKRRGAISVLDFRSLGYLPDALANYMTLLGWSPRDGVEVFSQKIPQDFEVRDCSKSPAFLDIFVKGETQTQPTQQKLSLAEIDGQLSSRSKLDHLNNQYMLRKSPSELYDLWTKWTNFAKENSPQNPAKSLGEKNCSQSKTSTVCDPAQRSKIELGIRYLVPHVSRLTGFTPALEEIFSPDFVHIEKAHQQLMQETASQSVLAFMHTTIESNQEQLAKKEKQGDPLGKVYRKILLDCGSKLGMQGKSLYLPIRIAMTGKVQGLEIPLILAALGEKEVKLRLKRFLKK